MVPCPVCVCACVCVDVGMQQQRKKDARSGLTGQSEMPVSTLYSVTLTAVKKIQADI